MPISLYFIWFIWLLLSLIFISVSPEYFRSVCVSVLNWCVCMCVCVCVCVCFVNCFKSDYQYNGILLSVGIGPTHTSSGGKYQGFGNMPAPKSKA